MLTTGNQLAAARALVGLDLATLSGLANVGVGAIEEMEAVGPGAIARGSELVALVQSVLEAEGVEFLGGGHPGVRLRAQADGGAAIEVEDLTSENDD